MIDFKNFLGTLPISGLGYFGVFIVMAVVYLCVYLLCKIFKEKQQ